MSEKRSEMDIIKDYAKGTNMANWPDALKSGALVRISVQLNKLNNTMELMLDELHAMKHK